MTDMTDTLRIPGERPGDAIELDSIVPSDTELPSDGDTLPSTPPSQPGLVQVPDKDLKDLPPVTFRPLVLRDWMLALCFVFHLICIALVATAFSVSYWDVEGLWTYVFIVALPYVLGTTSAIWVESITSNLSRITPFLLCADGDGALASRSIFQQCFPVPSMWDAWRSNCYFLFASHIIWWLTIFLVPLKASLLAADQETLEFWITDWAAYTLLGVHSLVCIYIVLVFFHLRDRKTGLREEWDIVTMADHMVLFRHSNFRHFFAGTGGAERFSMMGGEDGVLSGLRIKLGYWKRTDTDELWYGFGIITDEEAAGLLERPQVVQKDPSFSRQDLNRISNNSVYSFVDPRSFVCNFTFCLALVLAGAYITALAMGSTRNNEFTVPMSTGWAAVVFVLIPVFLLGTFLSFWSDAQLFAAVTQPFVGMREPRGRPAQDTILLDYVCLSNIEQFLAAAKRGHWKVALTTVARSLHRLLPNLAGPSLMVGWDEERPEVSVITLNVALVAVVSVWLVLELFLIPWASLTGVKTRRLPRDYLCIADLLSWTCTSDVLAAQGPDDLFGDALHVDVEPHPVEGQSQREDMEARLRLSRQQFRFGVFPVEGSQEKYMIGIGFGDSEGGEGAEDEQLLLLGAGGYVMAAGAEGTVAESVAVNGVRSQKPPEEERPEDEGDGEAEEGS